MTFFVLAGVIGSVTLAIYGAFMVLFPTRQRIDARLAAIRTGDIPQETMLDQLRSQLLGVVASTGDLEAAKQIKKLVRKPGAGTADESGYTLAKVVGLVAAPLGAYIVAASFGVESHKAFPIVAVIAAAIGFYGPNVWWVMVVGRRRDALKRALPDALDLLVVCVEAGMGLNVAFKRVAEKLQLAAPELSEEFMTVHREIQAGRAREEALRGMGERSGVDELRALSAMMVQTERLGTSIAKALRVQAESIRTKFFHEAEAQAARATVYLAFPLVLCIFPAMMVVVCGPAVMKIIEVLGGK